MLFRSRFAIGSDDWPKTRQAILTRLASHDGRAIKLSTLDLVTFRRLCETRGVPAMTRDELSVLETCATDLTGLSPGRAGLVRREQERLVRLLPASTGQMRCAGR